MKLTTAGQAIFENVATEWHLRKRSAVTRKGPASRKLITDGLLMPVENDTMLTLTDAGIALATDIGLIPADSADTSADDFATRATLASEHNVTEAMLSVIESVARRGGLVDAWDMKNVVLHEIKGATKATVNALSARGFITEIIRGKGGTPGSLHAWSLTVRGTDLAVSLIGDQVKVTEHTMSNGDIAYRAECLHGWATGAHAEANDAVDVAKGHGSVSRPLWELPIIMATPEKSAALMDRIRSLPGGDAPASAVERPRFSKHKSTSRNRRYRKGA